jgi:transcriptional regulator of heat shock response
LFWFLPKNMQAPVMHERRLEILRAIVDEYVATQEPVGSKAIAERHGLGVSPATIRNEMAALEHDGFITQPHTSAGRIPTNSGYRVFVDRIADIKPLSNPERRAIESFMSGASDVDDVMSRTGKLLAQITKQVAVVQLPSQDRVVLSGTANLALSNHDEASALHPILEALEEQVVLLRLLSDASASLNVRIGDEQPSIGLKSTSVVTMGYGQGAIGILGPTRMDYANSMAAVHAVARYIGRFLEESN